MRRAIALSLFTALLLSVVNGGLSKGDPAHDAYAKISHGHTRNSSTTTGPTTGCQQLPITGVTASGSDNDNVPTNVLGNNLNTRWSNLGIGSWIQADLGGQKTICTVDIAWYRGNLRANNFVIWVSNDGNAFTPVLASKSSGTTLSPERYALPTKVTAHFVRVTVNGNTENEWASITELGVESFGSTPTQGNSPTADYKTIQTTMNTPVQITLTGTDPTQGNVLKFSLVSLPQNGKLVTGPASHTVTYTPNNGFTGTDSFTYKSTDGQGTDSNIAKVTIAVNPVQPPPHPTADNKNVQTSSGTPVQITLTGADPIPGDALKFSVVSLPQHGSLAQGTSPNSVLYTSNTGFTGTDSFTYKSTDRLGLISNIATVTITVTAPPPTANDESIRTNSGAPEQITLTGTDPIPGDILKFSIVRNPQHGTLTPGTVSSIVFYTPNIGFLGTDSFTYKARDAKGVDSNTATVTMKIGALSSPSTTGPTSGSNVWSGYSSLGGNVLGDPTSARNSDGRLEVFVIGTDHALWHKSETVAGSSSGWTGYSSLGGYVIGNPVVAQNSDGRLEVFVIGSDHALYHESQIAAGSSSWSGFSGLGGNFIGNPAAARNSDGRLEVFVVGADHALYHNFQTTAGSTTSWSGFTNLGGSIISNPVAGQNGDGRLEVFVIGGNHALSHIFEQSAGNSNSWTGFSGLGGYIISDPVVASNSDSRLEVFVIGSDHAVYHIFEQSASNSNSWSGFSGLGGSILSNTNPAVALNSQGQLQVFVVAAADNSIIYKFQVTPGSSSWTGYFGLGGFVISNPGVAVNSDGRLELFVIGSDHTLWHNFQSSATTTDKFGINELYPSKVNGEQWFINMQNPTSDLQLNPNGQTLTRNSDGSYKVQSTQVRLQVFTSSGYHQNLITTYNQQVLAQKGYMQSPNDWKNVEITGYLKVNHFTLSTTNGHAHIALSARGGTHSSTVPCEGTAYWSNTYETGTVKFEKELEHTSGYTTNDPQIDGATGTLQGKWIGIKAVYYTFQNGSVKLEQWLDDKSDNINTLGNNWHKVIQYNDIGNWGGGIDNCGGTPTTIITWGGPIVQFRWDNIDDMDLKDLSVREIQPPQ